MRKASQKMFSTIFQASRKVFKEENHNENRSLSGNTPEYLRHIFEQEAEPVRGTGGSRKLKTAKDII